VVDSLVTPECEWAACAGNAGGLRQLGVDRVVTWCWL
jgi:hypothetical protein